MASPDYPDYQIVYSIYGRSAEEIEILESSIDPEPTTPTRRAGQASE